VISRDPAQRIHCRHSLHPPDDQTLAHGRVGVVTGESDHVGLPRCKDAFDGDQLSITEPQMEIAEMSNAQPLSGV